jgi:hypothetical protein
MAFIPLLEPLEAVNKAIDKALTNVDIRLIKKTDGDSQNSLTIFLFQGVASPIFFLFYYYNVHLASF